MKDRKNSFPWKCNITEDCDEEAMLHECLDGKNHYYYCEHHLCIKLGYKPREKKKK